MNASPDPFQPSPPVAIEPIVLNAEGETIYEPHARDHRGRTSAPHSTVRVVSLSGRSGWLVGLLVLAAIPVFMVAGIAIALVFGAFALLFWVLRRLLA